MSLIVFWELINKNQNKIYHTVVERGKFDNPSTQIDDRLPRLGTDTSIKVVELTYFHGCKH